MCAWWTGQPVVGSSPTSKFIRENFTYIKPLIDLLSGSAVTQADLAKLHAITASAYTIDRLNWQPWIGNLGTILDTAGVKPVALPFDPSVVIFLAVLSGWSPTGGGWSVGFDNGTDHMCAYLSQDLTDEHNYDTSVSNSIYIWHPGGTPTRAASITAKGATGFSITVTAVGVQTGYEGIFLALP